MYAVRETAADETGTQNREVRRESTGSIIQVAGSSEDTFRAELINASEKRKAETTRSGDANETVVEGKKRKKRRKKKQLHDSMTEENASIPDAAAATGPTAEIRTSIVAADHGEDSLVPNGLSRHQRRRWRRKLIRHGMMPKDQRAGSIDTTDTPSRQPSIERKASTASIDKPIGQAALKGPLATTTGASVVDNAESPGRRGFHAEIEKQTTGRALARRLATTTLMPRPFKRWIEEESSRTEAVPSQGDPTSGPWQRSASQNEDMTLRDSSLIIDTESNAGIYEREPTPAIPEIRTTTPEEKRSPQPRPATTLRAGLRLDLPPEYAPRATAKRASFGSKANSVPTYSVRGDAAERFKRFSAAAHGKAVGDSSDESSETSSSESEDENVSTAYRAAGGVARNEAGYDFPPQLDGAMGAQSGNLGPRDASNESTAFSNFMRDSHTSQQAHRGRPRSLFGSELGAGRSSSRVGTDRATNEGQAADDELPFPILDNESFDANQLIDEVFNAEMKLTRELPAGKRRQITDLECEDGILTLDSSDSRVTRSASKAKQAVATPRVDSANPDSGASTVIVRSMWLPADGVFNAPGDRFEAVPDVVRVEEGTQAQPAGETTQTLAEPGDHHAGHVEPSNLNQSSPVDDTRSRAAGQVDQSPVRNDEDGDTIVLSVVEQTPEAKKKRKMTGRTSKHFSTPKATRKKAAKKAEGEVSPNTPTTPGQLPTRKRKRYSPSKETLAESKALLDRDELGKEQSAERPKKRPRGSSGTLANVSADNILEGRSRNSSGAFRAAREPDVPLHHAGDQRLAEGNEDPDGIGVEIMSAAQEASGCQPKGNTKKRSRRDSGTLANLDASNIMERRSRHSGHSSNIALQETSGSMPAGSTQQDKGTPVATEEEQEPSKQKSKQKKRSRRSSGTIANLDASNILESRSRRSKEPGNTDNITVEDRNAADSPAADQPPPDASAKARPKRKSTGKRSVYFIPPTPPLDPVIDRVDHYNTTGKKKRVPAGTSTAPVPPISHSRFGIIQEKLWREPFWLLIAVTFLNKTAGRAAAPIFWKLKEKYQTPERLAEADYQELFEMVWRLGLQTQRSRRLIKMAKAWVEGGEPVKGRRWRVLNYPVKGDGKGYKNDEAVEEDAEDVGGAIEIGKIPGCGPYAWDSWRIFCRDVLRGVADDYNGENAKAKGFTPEWQKVLPLDKELRACLRWMWLREAWIWDPETGQKRRATAEEMERAVKGEMEVEDEKEREFAARAAGAEAAAAEEVVGQPHAAEEPPVPGAEESKLSSPPASAEAPTRRSERSAGRGKKRPATPEQDVGASGDDNIVVFSPAKRRTSGRKAAARV